MRIKRYYILTAILVVFCLLNAIVLSAEPGDMLDPTFGNGGIVITRGSEPRTLLNAASAMAIQADGKIIVVGEGAATLGFAVVRYNTDGSLDSSFGSGGIVITEVGSLNYGAASVALQPDGKIVVAGKAITDFAFRHTNFAVARYNPNGSLDTSFGGTGAIVTSIGDSNIAVTSVKIQSDGKIIAAGSSSDPADGDFVIVRYATDGSLDTSFGGTGIVIIDIGGPNDHAASVAIQPDGKIVVAGSSYRADRGDDLVLV